jgi:hypothetical protein
MKKKISIVGASLYGCLLAYYMSKKNYNVTIYEKKNEILRGFNHISIKNHKLNNGFHGFEYPRTKELIIFLKKQIGLNFKKILNVRKLLINQEIIDYTSKLAEMPKNIQKLYVKKNLKFYKNQNLDFFFKKSFVNKVIKNSKRFSDKFIDCKHFFLPWFLPADVKHLTNDEGHKFRSLVRNNKLKPYYYYPETGLFEDIKKNFLKKLKDQNIKIKFNSQIQFYKNKIYFLDKNNNKFYAGKDQRLIFCGSPIILLEHAKPKLLSDLNKFSRNYYNVLIRISKKNKIPYFSELLCLNDNIFFVNRISRVFFLENNKYYYIQVEVMIKNIESMNILLNNIKKELLKVFKIKNLKIIGIKHSRVTYTPPKSWYSKASKICKDFVKKKNIEVDNYVFDPLNTAKIWELFKKKLNNF